MLIKIDKTYTIEYSKSGIIQFAKFRYSKGILISSDFRPQYQPTSDQNILEGLNDIEDILGKIKEYSYCNNAEITAIDGLPIYFVESGLKEVVSKFDGELDTLICKQVTDFFNSTIMPIIKRRNWVLTSSWMGVPIIAERGGIDEGFQNISRKDKDLMLINYLCRRVRNNIGLETKDTDDFSRIYRYLDIKLEDEIKNHLIEDGRS